MSDRKTNILTGLDQTRHTLTVVLDHLRPEDWEQPVQDEDQCWTARQMVVHLVDSQKGMTTQIRRIHAGEETVPPDFDLNRWNRRAVEKAADRTPEELRAALGSDRAALKQVLGGLSDADLDKQGRHSSLKIMSIEEIAVLIGTHERDHAQVIARRFALDTV